MTNDAVFNSEPLPYALLALRRLVRGTLRQVGLAMMSLIVILNVAGHTPAADTVSPRENLSAATLPLPSLKTPFPENTFLETMSRDRHTATAAAQPSTTESAPAWRPHRSLHSKMTAHRLTSARLSLPSQTRVVVSIAEAQ